MLCPITTRVKIGEKYYAVREVSIAELETCSPLEILKTRGLDRAIRRAQKLRRDDPISAIETEIGAMRQALYNPAGLPSGDGGDIDACVLAVQKITGETIADIRRMSPSMIHCISKIHAKRTGHEAPKTKNEILAGIAV